jgi:hypothetical protein
MDAFTPYQALNKMKQLTECGIPFSFQFYSYSSNSGTSNGIKQVDKALLRLGLRKDQSDKADTLIAYTDCTTNQPRFFNLPLLIMFNGITIKP